MNKRVQWIVTTGVLTALLITAQGTTASFGNTLLTGSIVNLILVVSAMANLSYGESSRDKKGGFIFNYATGITVALISPVIARLMGIGPLWMLIPFIMAGNVALVVVWRLIGTRSLVNKQITYIISMLAAAIAKFAVLYAGIVKIAVPVLLTLPEAQAATISKMFSYPQLLTALIGGGLAVIILPMLKKFVV